MTTFFNLAITRTINRRDPLLIGDSLYIFVFLHMLGWMSMKGGERKIFLCICLDAYEISRKNKGKKS